MKKAELVTRITIVVLAIFSIIAVILQILNEKTGPMETAYEIITFSVAVVALTLAIAQGISNARTSDELKEIINEIHQVLKTEKAELRYEAKLAKEIEEDIEISRKNAKLLKNK